METCLPLLVELLFGLEVALCLIEVSLPHGPRGGHAVLLVAQRRHLFALRLLSCEVSTQTRNFFREKRTRKKRLNDKKDTLLDLFTTALPAMGTTHLLYQHDRSRDGKMLTPGLQQTLWEPAYLYVVNDFVLLRGEPPHALLGVAQGSRVLAVPTMSSAAECGADGVALGWVGLGWVGLGWVGLGWVGLGWVGLGWVGLDWGVGWMGGVG